MAIETEQEVRARVQQVAPGAVFTSGRRTPERNRAVGGVPNSLHTLEGEDGGARALDITPGASGLSMAELNARVGQSGLNLQERLNEGDHVHVGFDGKPSGGGGQEEGQPGYRSVNVQDLAPEDTPESLTAQGYQFDRTTNRWFRNLDAPDLPAPLDQAYAERQEARESLALDQEEADIMMAIQFQTPGDALMSAAGSLVGGGVRPSGNLEAMAADAGLDRSMGERFWDNVDQAFNLSAAGYLDRMIDPQNDGVDPVADFFLMPQIIEGKPIDWIFDQLMGEHRTYFRSVNDETRMDAPAIAAERSRRQRFQRRAEQDPVRNVGDGLASLIGNLAGSAASPENWVAPGRTLVGKVVGGAAVAGGSDALLQGADIGSGVQDDYSVGQTAGAVAVGAALPALTEVVGGMVRARRAAAAERGLQVDPVMAAAEATARGTELQASVRQALGNPEGPRFRATVDSEVIVPFQTKIAAAADDSITPRDVTASTDNVFDINLARINTPEDVQAVIVGMADKMRTNVDLARRGTRSWERTREAAGGVDWVTEMGARQPGGAVNAETALAYRMALNSSATKLLELARAVEVDPTLANQFAFRRATATHSAIQNELMGARAEAGRALNAFKIPADAPATYLRQVDSLIADVGGANSAIELARRIRMAGEKGDNALNQMVRGGAMAHTREIVKLVYTNSLLSGLGTPIINVAGNAMMLGLNFASRTISPRLAGAFGGNTTMKAGEASALVHGYQQAMRDIFRMNPMQAAQEIGANAGERLRRDGLFRGMAPGLDEAVPAGVNLRAEREEAGSAMGRPLAAAAWRVSEDSPLGRTLDIIQMLAEAPSNLNSLTDDFFKTVAARGELHAQVHRRVVSEGLAGEPARARYADLIQNPTDDMMKAAEKEMHELTFTRQGGFDKWASAGRRMIDENTGPIPMGTIVMPFLRTPANLVSVGMRYSPLAPMMKRTRDALAEGGAAAETAKAQMALGTALWSVYMGMAMDGDITGRGPGNRAQREAMQRQDEFGGSVFQPYSIRVGDRWFSFERADPMGQAMGLMADMADLMKNGDWDEAGRTEADEVAAHAIASIGQAFFDKTALRGITEMTSALLDGSNGEAERLLMSRASALIPGNSAFRTVRRAEDPYLRETHNVVTAMMNTMPGLSDDLPPQRDLWGRERRYYTEAPADQMYNTLGLQSRGEGGSAIDLEILNNGVSVAMPSRSISVAGETVSLKNRPDIYSEFLRLSGAPAFEQLNAVAEGRHPDSEFYYSLTDGPDGGKAEYIREVVGAYRAEARAAVTEMYASDLQGMAADRVRRREEARAGE